ncbi:hypothetical protein KDW67_34420 [Burkholderia cenocepacia]|uniref:hypothetical protein n=1 Tax=Burkholderia cenocepacia TaxID=95486 RepID=UPI00097C9F95|nr:hypothetical protein [Burkholderia cenocepacia]AQQ46740.1 hypothetical protein A8F32_13110 [Burkholderia cenocepacia]MBR8265070.1 hypothetical protein [Burkholderia cenocepacia]ONI97076.1 hypothetical protein A8F33_33225 [Burkholderia cenocepacia]ONJ01600.1 hypothetical protein A8F53_16450 [Burkholderia cenocepacia]ONJ33925.1 hypothetical protein A8F38_07385 [Burkholderia cenocepacia]
MTLDQQAAILRSELETQYTTPEAAFEALDATLEAPKIDAARAYALTGLYRELRAARQSATPVTGPGWKDPGHNHVVTGLHFPVTDPVPGAAHAHGVLSQPRGFYGASNDYH